MLDEINLPMVGLGGAFVAACVLMGVMLGRDDAPGSERAASEQPTALIKAADLDTASSLVSSSEQASAAKVCTEMMLRRNKMSFQAVYQRARNEDMPEYCSCIAYGAANQLSRFQFLTMEASFRAFADGQTTFFPSANERARSPEINRLGREAVRLGLSQVEVTARIDHADRTLNSIARNCAAELPKPKSPWQQGGLSRDRR